MTPTLPPDILTLIRHAPEGMALLSVWAGKPGQIVACNEEYARLHGYPADRLIGQPFTVLGSPGPDNSAPDSPAPGGVVLETDTAPGTSWSRTVTAATEELRVQPDGTTHLVEVARSAVRLQGSPYLLESARDADARRALIAQLSEGALQDALTGLGNRRAFEQDLELELARAARHHYPLTVLMADLDGLKRVNDERGHDQGDALLRTFAASLRAQFRTSDRLYRLGGDEFAAILTHADTATFNRVLGRVHGAMIQTREQTGLPGADVSVGYSTYPQESSSQGDLVRLADERMYGQKRAHHGAELGVSRAAGHTDATIQSVLRRTVRLTFALLSHAGEPTPLDWATLLEAAVIAVPDAECGSLSVLEDHRFVLRALVGQPQTRLGQSHTPQEALRHYGGSEEEWRHGRPHIQVDAAKAKAASGVAPDPASPDSDSPGPASPDPTPPDPATPVARASVTPAPSQAASTRTALCVPVVVEQKVVAHIDIESLVGTVFGAESLYSALEFAEQVAALLASRERLARETNRRRELEALAALNVALSHARTPETVEQVLADQAVELLVTRYATYLKYDPQTDCLASTVSSGKLAETRQVVLPRGVGLSWQAAEARQITRYDDARTEAGGYQHEQLTVSLSTLYAPLLSSGGQLLGVLAVGREASPFSDLDVMLVQAMISAAATSLERTGEAAVIVQARMGALHAVGLALETRDFETRGHTERVASLSQQMAVALGLDARQAAALHEGAFLHDIGKLSLPDEVLLKPGALTPEERALMQTHAQIGFDLSRRLPSQPGADLLILHHHEWWNGEGYPHRLSGEVIPLLARAFAVIDVYDALISERSYKRAWSEQEAASELRRLSGTQFDPQMVRVFLEMLKL
ncbi:diguanylate cyclase domain-containing protein [Deinococcus altitudinis]|uniref:diguanylate cyclase domain-containing protein n=1 Tax=Deinococcus altitudinis TaxID=468914 RepID=UPI003892041E